ncbi:hypothetical protein O6H91_07G014900 [Diphasiastrum complanatum]|uniref:Uncharacterized protein n=1 Tax=Diphasiastrum complanatum TaxID=34168 RepID=A0ACC2D2J8_DIPCM|nr:hypothetical protein O6H91_07G014900 [Diphasiastrum complanatum]
MLILVIVRHRRADMVKKTNGIYFPEERLCKWFAQLLLAVNYLHSSRVLHRDLKMAKMDIITRWVLSSWDNQLYVVTFQEARKKARGARSKKIQMIALQLAVPAHLFRWT